MTSAGFLGCSSGYGRAEFASPLSAETSCTAAISETCFGVLPLGNAVAPDMPNHVAIWLRLPSRPTTTIPRLVGGAAGPLYGTAFLRAAKSSEGDLDSNGVVAMIAGALDGIVARGKATTGEKTMVDAWAPASRAAQAAVDAGGDCLTVLQAAAEASAAGAEATKPMVATKGRASYLGERSAGHLDPGAVSTSYLLQAAAKAAEK